MKTMMKFLITLLVIAVVGFTAGYLITNSEKNVPESDTPFSGEVITDYPVEIVTSGEVLLESGEMISGEHSSGDNELPVHEETLEEKMARINALASAQVFASIESGEHQELTEEYLSESAKDVIEYFKLKNLGVTINQTERAIRIVPDSDFVETMIYVYDENGKLVLYESVSTTVGGSMKYYFEEGELLDTIANYEEEIEVKEESAEDILVRAHLIYNKYLK